MGYLRTGAVRDPCIGFEGDHLWVDYGLDFFRRHVAKTQRDHEVHFTVTLQDGEVLVAAERLRRRYKIPPQSLISEKRLKYTGSTASWEEKEKEIQLLHSKSLRLYRWERAVKWEPATEGHNTG